MVDGKYSLDITPVKKGHIAAILKQEVSQEYMDKHFPSDSYTGYSNNDFTNMGVDLDKHISDGTEHGSNTWISYDNSEDEY
ncbi:hypothetical protein [Limosilactobacillus pontis]|uniref:Uncharacterized protein n=1 Tax=Limosilactobacillus pontis TaxID=35787 RepID=A0ABU7SR22_9LACO